MDLSDVFIDDTIDVPALLKMVYSAKTGGFDCDVPELRHSHDLKINKVKNPGTLIAVESIRLWRKLIV